MNGAPVGGSVAASAFVFTKAWADLGEDEVLIGRPSSFTLTFRTAPAIALDDVDLFDDLPDTFVYASHTSSLPPSTVVRQPGVSGEPLQGGRLELLYTTVPANTTLTVVVNGSFPQAQPNGGPGVGGPAGQGVNGVAVVNTSTVAATFAKATANQQSLAGTETDSVTVRALRIQKSATPSASPPTPGASTISFRLRIDASPLFDFSLATVPDPWAVRTSRSRRLRPWS